MKSSTSTEKQCLLPHRERALHCYGYRVHVLWIFLLFQPLEKVSQTRVCKPWRGSLFLLGETCRSPGRLDSLFERCAVAGLRVPAARSRVREKLSLKGV